MTYEHIVYSYIQPKKQGVFKLKDLDDLSPALGLPATLKALAGTLFGGVMNTLVYTGSKRAENRTEQVLLTI